MAEHTINPANPGAPSAHTPATSPERNLHQDHDTVRQNLDAAQGAASDAAKTAGQTARDAADAVKDAASTASETVSDTASAIGDRISQTAEQLRAKADAAADRLKQGASEAVNRAHAQASQTYGAVGGRSSETLDRARDWATDRIETGSRTYSDLRDRGSERLAQGQSAVERFVTENPVLVGVVGLAAGMLLGALLPRTRQEDQTVGPYADEVRDQGLRYAREATERGRQFVESALDQAQDAAVAAANAASDELRKNQPGQTGTGEPGRQTH
ncbi:hypothetical protein FF100_17655 [Methylobacterium terricola]|uniref:Membrane-anchored ribosome-binding protein, inhibits growth in stationary phase, ElaB/YqjD/DUF883 family n=1 Tax=Methylobacterium terricola TaxID=2583531 RepID=A0A5C4LEE2_9HYPH|nr:hypothetical protein [Methylobacterium terricola]TNC12062.1 hypothetical protein FF100_17655 [Methylobacterium terricola]